MLKGVCHAYKRKSGQQERRCVCSKRGREELELLAGKKWAEGMVSHRQNPDVG